MVFTRNMEASADLTLQVLERCTYRDLQQMAKSMGLPSNVKKMYLIEMIHTKKYGSQESFNSVVARVKVQRKLASKPRKNAKKKKRVQGNEISSTSNQSPPISTTPQPVYVPTQNTTHTIMQCHTSILNPLITKRALNCDRVLRSYNNKLRRNMKYSFMNIDNTVMSVIRAQNTVKSSLEEKVCEWNAGVQRYRPVRAVLQKRESQSVETEELVLRQPQAIQAGSSQEYQDSGERQLVPYMRNNNTVARSQRRLSGIYPLKPAEQSQYQSSIVTYHGQDRSICKMNTMVQRQRPLTAIKNKMTQTTARKVKPIVVSLRDTIHSQDVATIQDIVNLKVEGSISNSSTETAEDSSNDRDNSAVIQQTKTVAETTKGRVDPTYVVKRKPGPKCYTRLMQKRQWAENRASLEEKRNETPRRSIEKVFVVDNDADYTDFTVQSHENREYDTDFSVQNHHKFNHDDQTGAEKTSGNRIRANKNRPSRCSYAVQNQEKQKNSGRYAIDTQNRQYKSTHDIQSQNRNDHGYAIENRNEQNKRAKFIQQNQNTPTTSGICAIENQSIISYRPYVSQSSPNQNTYGPYQYVTEPQNRCSKESYTDIYSNYIEQRNIARYARQENLNYNNFDHTTECSMQRPNESWVNSDDNPMANPNSNIERDYPNMSALTDVYPENMSVSGTQSSISASEKEMAVYYHKKIRAEQVRSRRESSCLEAGRLPRIADVFSQVHEPRYRHLTQPLYVDVGPAEKSSSSVLESVYNYKGPTLAAPLSQHHILRTTTETQTVYCMPIIATAVASAPTLATAPAPACSQYRYDQYGSGRGRASQQQYTIESEQVPRLQDYLRLAEPRADITCDEVVAQSPVSPASSVSLSSVALSTEMEDALDFISQDGDYMERISVDVRRRTQCFLCDWAGPRSIIEYHVRMNHPTEIYASETPAWSHTILLGKARDGVKMLVEYAGQIYVVNVLCRGSSYLHASLTMLPKDKETEDLPIFGRLTIYNKVSGEPFTWEGEICYLPLSDDEAGTNLLGLDQSGPSEVNLDQPGPTEVNLDQTGPTEVNLDQTGTNEVSLDHPKPTVANLEPNKEVDPEITGLMEQNLEQSEFKSLMRPTQSKFETKTNDVSDENHVEMTKRNLDQTVSNKHDCESNKSKLDQLPNEYNLTQIDQEVGLNSNQSVSNVLRRSDGLSVDLTSLDLLPNSANLKLVNGEWELKSSTKVVAGQPALDNIDVVIYVQVLE